MHTLWTRKVTACAVAFLPFTNTTSSGIHPAHHKCITSRQAVGRSGLGRPTEGPTLQSAVQAAGWQTRSKHSGPQHNQQ